MIGPLERLGAAATLGQHCPQMTQRRCKDAFYSDNINVQPCIERICGTRTLGLKVEDRQRDDKKEIVLTRPPTQTSNHTHSLSPIDTRPAPPSLCRLESEIRLSSHRHRRSKARRDQVLLGLRNWRAAQIFLAAAINWAGTRRREGRARSGT